MMMRGMQERLRGCVSIWCEVFDTLNCLKSFETNANGNDAHKGGGGVAYENGKERSLTADEMLEEINMPDVEY